MNDGNYRSTALSVRATPGHPAWVALQLGASYERVLLSWTASANYNYTDLKFGGFRDYRLETSSDSSNGSDGHWRVALEVTGNPVRTRAHVIGFAQQSWVRLLVLAGAQGEVQAEIDEIDVHDASHSSSDTWFFMGDSITAFAFDRDTPKDQPSFAESIHARFPKHFPMQINGGIGGERARDGASHIADWLALNPDVHFFPISYGTNDAVDKPPGGTLDTTDFAAQLELLVTRVLAAGRVPLLARIPFATDGSHAQIPRFNTIIDELTGRLALPPGPDLYAWFRLHPEQLYDGLHPTPEGRVAINRLWAEAVAPYYVALENAPDRDE